MDARLRASVVERAGNRCENDEIEVERRAVWIATGLWNPAQES